MIGQGEREEYQVAHGARPGQILVATSKLGDFRRLYSLEAGKLTPITGEMKRDVEGFMVDPARARIYARLNEDGYFELAVFDARTLRPVSLPKLPPAENVALAAVSRNGRFAELQLDGSTMVPQTGTPVTHALEHEASVNAAAFGPDRSRVVTASSDRTARVWNVAAEFCRPRRLEHHSAVYMAEFRSTASWSRARGCPRRPVAAR